jgi:hypothetical protein
VKGSIIDPADAGGTSFIADPPYLPLDISLVDANGNMNALWQRYHVANQDSVHTLQAAGSDHLLASHSRRKAFDAGTVPGGTIFVEVDRNNLIYVAGIVVDRWSYVCGVMVTSLIGVPTDVDIHDAGLLVWVSDFGHLMRWTGTEWQFGPGDSGNGYYASFGVPGQARAGWWALCDGSTVNYLVASGGVISTTDFETPIVANQYFRL